MFFSTLAVWCLVLAISCAAEDVSFRPCPLLGPRFPIPKHLTESVVIQAGTRNLTTALDAYVAAGDGDFGPITPNTTSFSVTLFSTEESNSTDPFFYEYHHSSSPNASIDAHTVLPVGDLTTMFTVWLFLIEAGEKHWSDPVSRWIPELAVNSTSLNHWDDITLGDLAGHISGLGRYSRSEKQLDSILVPYLQGDKDETDSTCDPSLGACDRAHFLSSIRAHAPISPPGLTPLFSNTAFILLALALESISGHPYAEMLNSSILSPLNMTSTSLLSNQSTPSLLALFNGLASSIHDISTALRAILSSQLLAPATTRRWLKPVSHTSNRANSVGRPWEIYSLLASSRPSPVIPVYQVRGNVGLYTSHIGLVPDYGVGFAIMAVDSERNADMNAIADVVAMAMIPALERGVIEMASSQFAGRYKGAIGHGQEVVQMAVAAASDDTAGLEVSNLTLGERDLRAVYASLQGIEPGNLSMRLYPTERGLEGTNNVAFRAVFQNKAELADAGTPTCETWRSVDALQYRGVALDEFEFEKEDGKAVGVEVKALGARLGRD